MTNEEIIYQITKAVYNRLGPTADRRLVEGLVTDIFSVIRPSLIAAEQRSQPQYVGATPRAGGSAERLVISVFGVDRPGIVAAISAILSQAQCNIIDINQTVVQDKFAMVMIVDSSRMQWDINQLKERFKEEGQRLGVRVYAQREDLFNAMHRV